MLHPVDNGKTFETTSTSVHVHVRTYVDNVGWRSFSAKIISPFLCTAPLQYTKRRYKYGSGVSLYLLHEDTGHP